MDQRKQAEDAPIPGRRSRSCGPLIAALLSLCALGSAALAQEPNVPRAMLRAGLDLPVSSRPCPPLSTDAEPVRAVYVDLETALRVKELPRGWIRRQQWLCAGFDIEVAAPHPSRLSLILESSSGDIWQLDLAGADEAPLEAGVFASERAGFVVNRIEWTGDGELAVLDVDLEIGLSAGASLWGRVLWNAAWTQDEEPFVPLTRDEWQNARPGEVSIRGPALDRLFLVIRPDGASSTLTTLGERMDSVSYSEEPVRDPAAARAEVAEDVARLSARRPPAAPASPQGAAATPSRSAASPRIGAPGSARPERPHPPPPIPEAELASEVPDAAGRGAGLEEFLLALRALAELWLQATDGSRMEARP